jgi:hypothetical protein
MSPIQPVAWQLQAGAALHVPSGPSLHLHVVLNDPIAVPGYGTAVVVVLVGISSVPQTANVFFDSVCVLPAGSHPSIHHESYVYYKGAFIAQAREIEERVQQGVYRPAVSVGVEVLSQIRRGLLLSKFTMREIQRIIWF